MNPRARYFVAIVDTLSKVSLETSRKLLEDMWEVFNVLDVVVMIGDDQSLYTWYPFHSSQKQIVRVKDVSDKIPRKFYNTTLKVLTYENSPTIYYSGNASGRIQFEGPEIDLLELIMTYLNISYIFVTNYVKEYGNQFGGLNTGEYDIFLASSPFFSHIATKYGTTISYYTTGMKWYIPCPKQIHRFQKIVSIFNLSTWGVLLSTVLAVIFLMWRLGTYCDKSSYYKSLGSCFSSTWAVCLGVATPAQPVNTISRFLFIIWVYYCYVINTLFQTFFTTYLVDPGSYSVIESYNDICEKSFNYGYEFYVEKFFFDFNHSWLCDGREYILCKGHENSDCFVRVVRGDDFAYLGLEFLGNYYVTTHLSRKTDVLCSLDGYFETLNIVMYVTRGSHFLNPINKVIRRIMESGIFSKFVNFKREEWKIQSIYNKNVDVENVDYKYFVFSLKHLQIAFFLLFGGQILSSIVFILEIALR
ncbi:hypothetical protein L9F63_021099 [Diploptera punctata]|uniref:Uncharacterized protein n=1 Tax=Diploptera punctata TaxID=6984 RepID=A0AAD8EBP8_DIPPU|nr:hypothetical protein L9F63_021099 [Diploptera punctata]